MKPILALVGRPNVGKSTLFNYITKSKDALVIDVPGVTRDRIYGISKRYSDHYVVIDTGGIETQRDQLREQIKEQTGEAVREADAVLFLVEAAKGLTAQDLEIFKGIRTFGKDVIVIANKADRAKDVSESNEFYTLGIENVFPVSATTGQGVDAVIACLDQKFSDRIQANESAKAEEKNTIRVAIVGRPNAGKSTLINSLIKKYRAIVSDAPGTTRDSLEIPFVFDDLNFILIDTAGMRRKSKVSEVIEKFSVIKTLQAIESSQVVILIIDGLEEISEQDAKILGMIMEFGRAVVIAINKTDACSKDEQKAIKSRLDLKLGFCEFAERLFISAKYKKGLKNLMRAVTHAHRSTTTRISTPQLTHLLEDAIASHQPPLVKGRRVKPKYMHQIGVSPPQFIVYGNQVQSLPGSYKRYLENYFRDQLQLVGTPIRLVFRRPDNPYAKRRNKLTPRQQRTARRRLRKS